MFGDVKWKAIIQGSCLLAVVCAPATFSLATGPQEDPKGRKKRHLILNGGGDAQSNHFRYLENVRAMYEGMRSTGAAANDISVLYGSGSLRDTRLNAQSTLSTVNPYGGATGPGGAPVQPSGMGLPPAELSAGQSSEVGSSTDRRLTEKYVFSGEEKGLTGGANKRDLKERFLAYAKEMEKGGELTLFVTDHGSLRESTGTEIVLWGETVTVEELNEYIGQLPQSVNVRVITNICFGGGLAELTSDRVCVFASQKSGLINVSESENLNLYAQNFSAALKERMDYDGDGKVTYTDAHLFAASMDNKSNIPETSLDRFLRLNRARIVQARKAKLAAEQLCIVCNSSSDRSLKVLNTMLDDLDRIARSVNFDAEKIPSERRKFMKGRLEKTMSSAAGVELKVKLADLDLKKAGIQKFINESAAKWEQMSPDEKFNTTSKANLEAEQLKGQIAELEALKSIYESVALEVDLLKYGDNALLQEYERIRKCMDYEYLK